MEQVSEPDCGPALREDVDAEMLYRIYRQMARIHLELSLHDFDSIGALAIKQRHGRSRLGL